MPNGIVCSILFGCFSVGSLPSPDCHEPRCSLQYVRILGWAKSFSYLPLFNSEFLEFSRLFRTLTLIKPIDLDTVSVQFDPFLPKKQRGRALRAESLEVIHTFGARKRSKWPKNVFIHRSI